MNESVIMIPTDAATAARYNTAPDAVRDKIRLMVGLLLPSEPSSPESLLQLMERMSAEAQSKGLTPEILDEILNDDA